MEPETSPFPFHFPGVSLAFSHVFTHVTARSKKVTVEELNADIDRLNASIISLAEDIVSTQRELSASAKALGGWGLAA